MAKIIEQGGISFSPKWIKDGADANMVKFAEATAQKIQKYL